MDNEKNSNERRCRICGRELVWDGVVENSTGVCRICMVELAVEDLKKIVEDIIRERLDKMRDYLPWRRY